MAGYGSDDSPVEFGGYGANDTPVADGIGAKPKKRSIGDIAGDIGVTALKGAVALPQSIVGIADIPTGGRVGKALEGIGYRPAETQKILDAKYSEPQQAANKAVRDAEGFVPTLKAATQNPSTILTTVGEAAPQIIGGAGIARGLIKGAEFAGKKLSPVVAGAIGEGAIGAGSAAENIRSQTEDGLLTPKQSLAAAGSGLGATVFGVAGGKLAQRFKFGDVDTILTQGGPNAAAAGAAKQGFFKQIAGSGIAEGVFEELPQSVQEQMWQNFATDKPLTEGVGNAAAMGLLAGTAMGGVAGGYNAFAGQPGAVTPEDPAISGLLTSPVNTGTPSDQVITADVERANAVAAAQANADALYQSRAEFEAAQQPTPEAQIPEVNPTTGEAFTPDEVSAFQQEQSARQSTMQRDVDIRLAMDTEAKAQLGTGALGRAAAAGIDSGAIIAEQILQPSTGVDNGTTGSDAAVLDQESSEGGSGVGEQSVPDTLDQPDGNRPGLDTNAEGIAPGMRGDLPVPDAGSGADAVINKPITVKSSANNGPSAADIAAASRAPTASGKPLSISGNKSQIDSVNSGENPVVNNNVQNQSSSEFKPGLKPSLNPGLNTVNKGVSPNPPAVLLSAAQDNKPTPNGPSITLNQDGSVHVSGYSVDALQAARTQLKANALIDQKGQAVFRPGTNFNALRETLNPGSTYIPKASELKAIDFPRYVHDGKFSNSRAHSFAMKFGAKSFDDKADAQAYADALIKGEGGQWRAKKHLGEWRAARVNADTIASQQATPLPEPGAELQPTRPTDSLSAAPELSSSASIPHEEFGGSMVDKPAPIARVGTTLKNAEDITVKDGVVYIGKFAAQNFGSGEDITVGENADFAQVKKALQDGGALTSKQRVYPGVFGSKAKQDQSINAISTATPQVEVVAENKVDVKPTVTTKPPSKLKAMIDARLANKEIRDLLPEFTKLSGWSERGGSILRDANTGEVTGRTKWIPRADWWMSKPGSVTEKLIRSGVPKALNTQPITKPEREAVEWLLSVVEADIKEMNRESVAVANEIADDLDNIPFDALGETDTRKQMESMGFSEDEINETLETDNRKAEEATARPAQESNQLSNEAQATETSEVDRRHDPARTEDRRQDHNRRLRVSQMTPEEKTRALLIDEMTGLGTKTALKDSMAESKEAGTESTYVFIDADGLKWINDNLGHESGDRLLETIGKAIAEETNNGYHISGDEYVIKLGADAKDEAALMMARVVERLDNTLIEGTSKDGDVVTVRGIGISFGIDGDKENAEKIQSEHKAQRERDGLRGRGAVPRNTVIGKGVRQDQQDNAPAEEEAARPELNLEGQTQAEIAATEAASKKAAEKSAREDAKPTGPDVTADQVDLFNTQGGLFDRAAEAKPAKLLKHDDKRGYVMFGKRAVGVLETVDGEKYVTQFNTEFVPESKRDAVTQELKEFAAGVGRKHRVSENDDTAMFQPESAYNTGPFYSQLSRAIESAPDKVFTTATQFKLWLNSNAAKLGVKKDEITWSGIEDFLDMQGKGKVSKTDVMGFLSTSGIRVEDVVLGRDIRERDRLIEARNRGEITTEELSAKVKEIEDASGAPKFATYIPPGGIPGTYREILVTLPTKPSTQFDTTTEDGRDAFYAQRDNTFKSSHFDQPNILVHLRTDEVTGADGKRYLRVVEVQSDFGQSFKKQKDAIKNSVDTDFHGIVDRMTAAGVLKVVC